MTMIYPDTQSSYTTFALVSDKLAACEQHVAVWWQENTVTRVLCVLATFVVGVLVGYRLAYRRAYHRGLQDGNPFLASSAYCWLLDIKQ